MEYNWLNQKRADNEVKKFIVCSFLLLLEETTGLNYWFGVVILVAITGGLMFFGDALIERFETWGTVLLYVGYIVFSGMVIMNGHENISRVMTTSDMSYSGETGIRHPCSP